MTTLHETTLFNNANIKLINNGGELTSDAGLVLIKTFMDKLGLDSLLKRSLNVEDHRRAPAHTYLKILEQVILQIIAGYKYDVAANRLQHAPLFKILLDQSNVASQPTISRFFSRLTASNISEL
jgi:hypothetical protein